MSAPFTETRFSSIRASASRLEHRPDRAITFATRSPAALPSSKFSFGVAMSPASKRSYERMAGALRLKEAGRAAFIVEIDVAIGLLKPRLFRVWHDNIDQNRKRAEEYGMRLAITQRCAEKA